MEHKQTYSHLLKNWLFLHIVVFTFSILFFISLILFTKEHIFEYTAVIFLFIILIVWDYCTFNMSWLSFNKNDLFIKDFILQAMHIPYNKILNIYIRQTPINKKFNVCTLIIKFDNPKRVEAVTIRAFGLSRMTISGPDFAGLYGNLYTIPYITRDQAEELANNIIKNATDHPLSIEELETGYPYYDFQYRLSYCIDMALYRFVTMLIAVLAVMYIILWILMKLGLGH